jgi:hypothetical protein
MNKQIEITADNVSRAGARIVPAKPRRANLYAAEVPTGPQSFMAISAQQ